MSRGLGDVYKRQIDGFLIGGASTNEKIFIDIIRKSIILMTKKTAHEKIAMINP